MEFFIDTSNIDQIKKYKSYNIFSGVTTNPSLLSKEPGRPVENLKKICKKRQIKLKFWKLFKPVMSFFEF